MPESSRQHLLEAMEDLEHPLHRLLVLAGDAARLICSSRTSTSLTFGLYFIVQVPKPG